MTDHDSMLDEEMRAYPSWRNIQRIQSRTQCIYAPKARNWGNPPWREELSLEENLSLLLPHLVRFVDISREQRLDGYGIDLPGRHGADLDRLAWTVRRVLEQLSRDDPAGGRCMEREIETASWCFELGGEKIFVNSFAPCYPPGHSRYAFECGSTLILFQPRHSFAQATIEGDSALSETLRARIRGDYRDHGRPYDTAISAQPFEAYRIVRPLGIGDPPVRWWEAGPPAC